MLTVYFIWRIKWSYGSKNGLKTYFKDLKRLSLFCWNCLITKKGLTANGVWFQVSNLDAYTNLKPEQYNSSDRWCKVLSWYLRSSQGQAEVSYIRKIKTMVLKYMCTYRWNTPMVWVIVFKKKERKKRQKWKLWVFFRSTWIVKCADWF